MKEKILEYNKDSFLPHHLAIAESVTRRIPEYKKNWEKGPMELYRETVLKLLQSRFQHPKSGHSETLFEYGAGIGRITREIVTLPYIRQSGLHTQIIANDLSEKALEEYWKSVSQANSSVQLSFLIESVVDALTGKSLKGKMFDNAYAFGVYQISEWALERVVEGIVKKLIEGGVFIFDCMQTVNNLDYSHYKNAHGEYTNYRYSRNKLTALLNSINMKLNGQFTFEVTSYAQLSSDPMIIQSPETGKEEKFDPLFVVVKKESGSIWKQELQRPSEQTQPGEHIEEVAKNIGKEGTDNEKINRVLNYLRTLRSEEFNKDLFRRRSAEQIIQDGFITGCSDSAVVFLALARSLGIPAAYVEAFNKKWLESPISSKESERGHIFSHVWIDDKWVWIDPENKSILPVFPDDTYVLYKEGKDSWNLNIYSYEDLKNAAIPFKQRWQTEQGLISETTYTQILDLRLRSDVEWRYDEEAKMIVITRKNEDNIITKHENTFLKLVKQFFQGLIKLLKRK